MKPWHPRPKTLRDLEERLDQIGLSGGIETDNEGQLVVYTGLKENNEGFLVEMSEPPIGDNSALFPEMSPIKKR